MLHTGDFVLEVNGECVGGIVFEDVLALFAKDGRYNELISTPNISQLVLGVEFFYMGRLSELDSFAIQLLYCGSLEESSISKHSYHDNW